MLEACQGKAVAYSGRHIVIRNQAVQHAGRKGVAGSDPVDDPRHDDFIRREIRVPCIDSSGDAMAVGVVQMPRCRSDHLQLGKGVECGDCRLATPLPAFAAKLPSEQQ